MGSKEQWQDLLGSRPASAASSRPPSRTGPHDRPPSRGGSLPTGAPLMHVRKQAAKRFLKEDQVDQFKQQMLNGLGAIERQVHKTIETSSQDLRCMDQYLTRAKKVLERERELQMDKIDEEMNQPEDTGPTDATYGLSVLNAMNPIL